MNSAAIPFRNQATFLTQAFQCFLNLEGEGDFFSPSPCYFQPPRSQNYPLGFSVQVAHIAFSYKSSGDASPHG